MKEKREFFLPDGNPKMILQPNSKIYDSLSYSFRQRYVEAASDSADECTEIHRLGDP